MGITIDVLLKNNEAYAMSFARGYSSPRAAKQLAVVTCMDPRLNIDKILGLEEGDAHIIRNAGGILSDDVIRSLTISQRLMGTREIVLIHHTDCGMMKFADDDLKRRIRRDVGAEPAFSFGAFSDLEDDMRRSIDQIKECRFIPHRDSIRGFVYDVETGRLHEVT